ncbi:YggS family pyridoxal phosphate-dependent enzyme [Sporosarcina sp. G11-34]|uniref:YggS family pyridoxal phosphate-dependent enzyme n=1 Tax=Sporosarcina sp. G11-34 TaxID=2849605 RepID=UPI0022A9898F|nr:YggS family pyridoxal phosphate-dependent enzyme [Sporosarcina sp. G11-34]MCZ2258860.1 YggS family pyridoxal phosphate-dependent enzyme [Sporosarcina sp. G11-34]
MSELKKRIQKVEQEIQTACDKSKRNRSEINVVAVTKSVSAARAEEVKNAGIIQLGENRAEGLIHKQEVIKDGVDWHFIGNIQSRKVRGIIDEIDYLHSLDRISIAKEIQKRATKKIKCFVQVNVSGESSKSGVSPEELEGFVTEIAAYDKIEIVGLMTMAPHIEDTELIRSYFRNLKELRDDIVSLKLPHAPCTELSMGMSNDFTIAIEEGATYVRIGTALVGAESEGNV